MTKRLFICTVWLFLSHGALSQLTEFWPDSLFENQAVDLEGFFQKFNGKDYPRGIKKDSLKYLKMTEFFQLFDRQFVMDAGADSAQRSLISSFVEQKIAESPEIGFASGGWFSEVVFEGALGDQNVKVRFLLEPIVTVDSIRKWQITAAHCPELLDKEKKPESIYLTPYSADFNFLSLYKLLYHDTENLDLHFREMPRHLDGIYYLLNQGVLTFSAKRKVKYYFTQVPGFVFSIRSFNRPEANAGWLISGVSVNELEYPDFLQAVLESSIE